MIRSPAVRRMICTAGPVLALLATAGDASAQGKLDATYTISAARIPIGSITASAEIGDDSYTISMGGRASGVMRILASGEGTFSTRGTRKDGRLIPTDFVSKATSEDDTMDVKMVFADGSVKELSASAPPPSNDRVPLTEAHRQNVVDPLTAILVPAAAAGNGLSEAACQRALAVFDGRRRYDLKLAFKRMDKAKADKGYAGPVAVCAVTFQPIAGHRASSTLVKYLAEGREIEIAFAPVAGARVLTPFRMAVNSMLGNLVIEATRFESVAQPANGSIATQTK